MNRNSGSLGRMNRLRGAYLCLAILGLVVVCYCIVRSMTTPVVTPFLDALFGNWTTTTLMIDLLVAIAAAIVWAIVEAKRLGMRWPLWLLLMATTPIAFSLPLFLAAREKRRDSSASRVS